jgi:hypothetical protein
MTEPGRNALLLDPATRVTCPKCEHEFSLEEGFAKKSLESIEAASHGALAQLQAEARQLEQRRAAERAAQRETELQERLTAQAGQIATFQANELALRKQRAELETRQQQLELDVQRRVDESRRQIEETTRAAEGERARLREADLQKRLDDAMSRVAEMQRQLEQGSQQLQGEVLELLLQEELAAAFPIDSITEVKKGARGGDAVHTVKTRSEQVAGIILWEAKRAQRWSGLWPAKLKEDMRQAGAVAGVIVTTSFPSDWPERKLFGLHEGVWLTSAAAAIPMAAVLREGLLEAHKARVAVANKGEKMEAVYDYLTSPQFAHKLKAVYEVFGRLREELHAERTAMQQRWKRREKQIELATVQLVGIAGDLQGLAQQDLPQLELEPKALEAPDDAVDAEGDEPG